MVSIKQKKQFDSENKFGCQTFNIHCILYVILQIKEFITAVIHSFMFPMCHLISLERNKFNLNFV